MKIAMQSDTTHMDQTAPKHGTRLNLAELPTDQCGVICHVDAADDDIQRLMTMGVCLGRRVQLVQTGNPMIIHILGARIGVSHRLAKMVTVEICENPTCSPNPSARKT